MVWTLKFHKFCGKLGSEKKTKNTLTSVLSDLLIIIEYILAFIAWRCMDLISYSSILFLFHLSFYDYSFTVLIFLWSVLSSVFHIFRPHFLDIRRRLCLLSCLGFSSCLWTLLLIVFPYVVLSYIFYDRHYLFLCLLQDHHLWHGLE